MINMNRTTVVQSDIFASPFEMGTLLLERTNESGSSSGLVARKVCLIQTLERIEGRTIAPEPENT
jgi:hypothetical protein